MNSSEPDRLSPDEEEDSEMMRTNLMAKSNVI
jgi:hypothetical protein